MVIMRNYIAVSPNFGSKSSEPRVARLWDRRAAPGALPAAPSQTAAFGPSWLLLLFCRKLYESPDISGRECGLLSGPRFDSRHKLWSGRSRSPGDRAERADQAGVGGEPVPRHLAGVHDVGQATKYRVGEPVAAQIVPNPLHRIELRAVRRQLQQSDIAGHHQALAPVPAGTIEKSPWHEHRGRLDC